MATRTPITLSKLVSGEWQPLTGATVKLYVYDEGNPPTYRGALIGTFTESPSGSGQYYLDITDTIKGVVTVQEGAGAENNLSAWQGRKFIGDTVVGADEIDTIHIKDGAVTAEKTDFLYE